MILKLYLSKEKELSRSEFCNIVGISFTNFNSYKKLINILGDAVSLSNNRVGCEVTVFINRDKLNDFISDTELFKTTEDFIVKSRPFSVTQW